MRKYSGKSVIAFRTFILLTLGMLLHLAALAQPANDHCAEAGVVAISNGGYGTGAFTSTTHSITSATVDSGETFAPAILGAGQSQKSIWYKFTLPTSRSVRVTLGQAGNTITAGDVGFAVYKSNDCNLTNAKISTKLTPIGVFGNTYHPCVDSGVYYVQVSAKNSALGQVYITVETDYTTASYDRPAQAYDFGTLVPGVKSVAYGIECQSIEDANEVCPSLSDYTRYTKSTWHVFKTPSYFDFIALMVAQEQYVNGNVIGFKIYEGDVTSSSYNTLPVVVSCDTFALDHYLFARKLFKCGELSPGQTYSVQLFFKYSFSDNIKVSLALGGTAATKAPIPVSGGIPSPSNNLGVLASSINGVNTTASDYFGCNSRHSVTACGPAVTANGVKYAPYNYTYNLSSFFTFTLSSTSNVNIYANNTACGGYLYLRLFKQDVTASCSGLDTTNIINQFPYNSGTISCLPPGKYTLQVMGRDSSTLANNYSYYSFGTGTYPYTQCLQTDLGTKFDLNIYVKSLGTSKYNLTTSGAFDSINVVAGQMQAMVNNTPYTSKADTFSCVNTVLPWDTVCAPGNTKGIYREMMIADSGVLTLWNMSYSQYHKLYKGDAAALANAQNLYDYPGRIQGLEPYTKCLSYSDYCWGTKVCVVPGTYTHVSFGADGNIMQPNQPMFQVNQVNTMHNSPSNAEDMGDLVNKLSPTGGTTSSTTDYYSCKDNAIDINGYKPCTIYGKPATKAIYRQFYLSKSSKVTIDSYWGNCYSYTGYLTLFTGKITDGTSGLAPVTGWTCFQSMSTNSECNVLPEGWYTVVAYGSGPTYEAPMQNVQQGAYGSYVGLPNKINITISFPTCPGPKYNRPIKAAIDTVTKQPFLIQWGPRAGHTAAYPKTDTTYTLYRENFNCTVDTPFSMHPIPNCSSSLTKVAYYVFRTTQESYVQIDTKYFWAAVYSGDARNGTAGFDSTTMIQSCLQSYGKIQLCRLQPGTYTLLVFADNNQNCTYVEPTIYIDKIGYSRFDHAINAYDFGTVPPDSTWHNGKVGDVNPLDANRAPSNDFFYCTTGAQKNDPADAACGADYVPQIYDLKVNNALYNTTTGNPNNSWAYNIPRRNLWYTFAVNEGGYVKVRVNNKTIGKGYQYRFAIYKTDASGSIPFSTLVSTGAVDSTAAQGLTYIGGNGAWYYCFGGSNEFTFYREPCSPTPERYYIVVENTNSYYFDMIGMRPNSQVEVSILMDSVNAIKPLFDHYSSAGTIGTNLGSGTYSGPRDNYSCATRDATDPVNSYYGNYSYCANKTLWYKFSTTVTGKIRYRVKINNTYQYGSYYDQIMLFRETIPGDSTSRGLTHMNYTTSVYDYNANTYWYQTCITPGTYYILLPGCNRINEYVYPEIQIEEEPGDFCSAPMIATLNGPGSKITPVKIDCHTIGTDYGEFNPTLTCPNGAPRSDYKTSWFRLDVGGTDTLDVTTYLSENTNANSTQIKYRMMIGDCGSMQERSCVQDALTRDTYKCLLPGKSYFFQVFSPSWATGTIDLNLSAVPHADTCAPENKCLSTSAFIPVYDCTKSDTVSFQNISTFGSTIQYEWDFGYNNQTSTAVSPVFAYPALAISKTYTVKLKVTNTGCLEGLRNVDSSTVQVTMPGRPNVNLGPDTTLCTYGASLKLDAGTWPGATYQWNTGQTTPSITASYGNVYTYSVKVEYNGCIKRDTITVGINPIPKQKATRYLCGNDSLQLYANRGYSESHLWTTGSTNYAIWASQQALYQDSMRWRGCSIVDTFNIISAKEPFPQPDTTLCDPFRSFTLNATTPEGQSYSWQNGSGGATFSVTKPGTYWVQIWNGTCYKRDTVNVLATPPVVRDTTAVTICSGHSYTLPWGGTATASGLYSDTLHFPSGCDSLIRSVKLSVTAPTTQSTTASICQGDSYTLPWGGQATMAGVYSDTARTAEGCDSLVRKVTLTVRSVTNNTTNITLCAGQTYTLPWGRVANSSGTYADTLRYTSGCDSAIRTYNVEVKTKTVYTSAASICSGASYTLPWGALATATGRYSDTLRYTSGCDSVITVVNLTVNAPLRTTSSVAICEGDRYTLPWGTAVSDAGTYRDTTRYNDGCDSLIREVNLTVRSVSTTTTNATVCGGDSYILPWGSSFSTAGQYRDTLHYASGCDSLIRIVNLQVDKATDWDSTVTICRGDSYQLPWGPFVNTAGVYSDTSHYTPSGCDSLRRHITVVVHAPQTIVSNPTICSGGIYTLPWGGTVSDAGTYRDTARYTSGCDSLIRVVNLVVQAPAPTTTAATICEGQSYTLPWGVPVNTTGTYRDTLHYSTGCDSLYRIVSLTVNTVTKKQDDVTICSGTSYQLPWGGVVSAAGTYRDTLHYATGCDSILHTVNLSVTAPQLRSSNVTICEGGGYNLPWNRLISSAGVYSDTLRSAGGCDSIITQVRVAVNTLSLQTTRTAICAGRSYQLPWGVVVSKTGVYSDTLHYRVSGCDSVIRIVDLLVRTVATDAESAVICSGQQYTLPWGGRVSTAGVYYDTLRYNDGCDSVIRSLRLSVNTPTVLNTTTSICDGASYALPWGKTVSAAGTYRDTARYVSGCDSVIREVVLSVKGVSTTTTSATICSGQTYTLPWGRRVSTPGLYIDTLHYATGCDSLVRKVDLTVKALKVNSTAVTICSGKSYQLPWGRTVSAAGAYSDTLRYRSGCDSVINIVNLAVTKAASVTTVSAQICEGERYQLPNGQWASATGSYTDTVRTAAGCDSAIRTVNLKVNPNPMVRLSKSNDINCMLGTARLQASGGARYQWSPAATLSNTAGGTTVATPTTTTTYKVQATSAEGCTTADSITVVVMADPKQVGFELPNAFTPNNDGKNDCFGVKTWGAITDLKLTVYNRWGELVFTATDPRQCWDGTYKGVKQASAVFVYQITCNTICGKVYRNGTVTLIR